jgi:hypothetical protein
MNFPTPEAMFSFLDRAATEEDYDAEFLEECARKFAADKEHLLHNAKIYRERAHNIRANLAFLLTQQSVTSQSFPTPVICNRPRPYSFVQQLILGRLLRFRRQCGLQRD